MAAPDLKAALAARALAEVPKILTLQDRTPLSPTYGCFDRAYWHYRMMDFPSGMSQEFCLPLALVWSLDLPDNPYRGQEQICAWAEAGIRYAARSAHADGSCDDYYPFERAAGAAAFSLFASLESARILGLDGDPEIDAFLKLRARWLAEHEESGRLSNHEALIVACLARMGERFGSEWDVPLRRRAARLLSWQDPEGWFDEYGGADPGYLSLTIGMMADADRRRPDLGLREPARAAMRFLASMLHPDGTIGGEYTSRATQNFFPHGLEMAAAWEPLGPAINDLALRPLVEGRQPAYGDDHIIGHHAWSWLIAWREWQAERPGPVALPRGRIEYPNARLLVDARGEQRLYVGPSRGGAFKLFAGDRHILSDTGPSLRTRGGKVAVTHLEGTVGRIELDRIALEGRMAWAKSARLTPAKSIILRSIMISFGRFFPDLIRRLLQRLLVTGRQDAPFRFRRDIEWRDGAWQVRDEIIPDRSWNEVAEAGIGGFQTSVTTIMARLWQPHQLQPWLDLTAKVRALKGREPLIVERRLGA